MTYRRNPLTLHGVIEAAAAELGGWDVAADVIEKPGKWLRDASNPHLEGRHANTLTFAQVRTLTRAGAQAFAQDLAASLGMALVPLGAEGANSVEVMNKTAALMGAAGQAVALVGEAAADGVFTNTERDAARTRVLAVKKAAHEVLSALGGDGGG